MGVLGLGIVIFAISFVAIWLTKRYQHIKNLLNKIQGPDTLPLIGNLHQFRFDPDGSFFYICFFLIIKF